MRPHPQATHAPRRRPRRPIAALALAACVGVLLLLALRPAAPPAVGPLGPHSGERAPALRLSDLQGDPLDLASLRGHPVALVFLATWCEGCRAELPALVRAAPALQRRGLVLLGVDAVGEDRSSVTRLARAYHVPFPVLLDPSSGAMTSFAVAALPTTVVIDRAGRIVLHQEAAVDGAALARAAFAPPQR